MFYTHEQTETLAKDLRGTCCILEDALAFLKMEDSLFTQEDWHALDELVGECVICGWWHDRSEILNEVNDDQVCDNCYMDLEDDDEDEDE